METASAVRITKIKVSKDRLGTKLVTIELTRVVEREDKFIGSVAEAIDQMTENESLELVKLSTTVGSKNLIFWPAAGIDRPSETFVTVMLKKFRIKREGDEEHSQLVMSFEFTVPLEEARRWVIPAIGDDVMCVVEDSQLALDMGTEQAS